MATSMRPPHDGSITKAVSISALVISLPIIYVSLLRVPPSTLARDTTFWFLMSNSIIAIIAADSGMLFFGTAASCHDDVPADEQPAPVATQQISYEDATSSVMAARLDEPTMVGISPVVVGDEELRKDGPVVASNDVVLALIKDDGAASKPCSTDMGHAHASVQQRREEELEEEASVQVEPIRINKNCSSMIVKGGFASKEIVKGDEWPILHPPPTTTADDHVPKDEGSVEVPTEERKPARCSVAEEMSNKTPPPDEREYWQLSNEELNRKVEEFITRFNRDMVEQEARV